MSDIKLYNLQGEKAIEVVAATARREKLIQNLCEANLEQLFGVRFLATEHRMQHQGAAKAVKKADTLGLNSDNRPVIIEYKRKKDQNILTQGVAYIRELLRVKDSFRWIVSDIMNQATAKDINWHKPRLICIAEDFGRFDADVTEQKDCTVELVRYCLFGDNQLLLHWLTPNLGAKRYRQNSRTISSRSQPVKSFRSQPEDVIARRESLHNYLLSLGDDVQSEEMKVYVAYRRENKNKNFAALAYVQSRQVITLNLNPDQVQVDGKFVVDVRGTNGHGIRVLEINITSDAELEKAKHYFRKAYEAS